MQNLISFSVGILYTLATTVVLDLKVSGPTIAWYTLMSMFSHLDRYSSRALSLSASVKSVDQFGSNPAADRSSLCWMRRER